MNHQEILKKYAAIQKDAIAASIKLNQVTDQILKDLEQLQEK